MSTQVETVDGTAVEEGHELVAHTPTTLFRTDDPVEVIEKASVIAKALADVIQRQKLFMRIRNKNHVLVEGWTTLGSMLGVVPFVEWSRPIEKGWEARVLARTLDGRTIGAAEASCTRDETRWKSADDYAVRSMAQTRATSKALRGPLGFIVHLAGYSATPAEEMPSDDSAPESAPAPSSQPDRVPSDTGVDVALLDLENEEMAQRLLTPEAALKHLSAADTLELKRALNERLKKAQADREKAA